MKKNSNLKKVARVLSLLKHFRKQKISLYLNFVQNIKWSFKIMIFFLISFFTIYQTSLHLTDSKDIEMSEPIKTLISLEIINI